MEKGYTVKISDSSKELTAKEKVMFKDTGDCVRLDTATKESSIDIIPIGWVVLDIHNEKSEDKDYKTFIIIADDGVKYLSGSENLFNTFMNIWDDMSETDEEWGLRIYRLPSKNYQGRDFITCSII